MLLSLQANLIFTMTIIYGSAVKPPGYVQPSKAPDPNPPKYEYGYKISDEKGSGQGKQEQRDGIYALGRYYVQDKDSNQDVQYFADDWGYHPVVEYSSVGPHSQSTTKFALGTEAVQQLKNKENNLPQLQGIFNGNERLDTLNPSPSSNEKGSQQTILQPQRPLFTPQPQSQLLQQPQQSGSGVDVRPHLQQGTAGNSPTGQQDAVQPVLLSGEQQLFGIQNDLQPNGKQQNLLEERKSQVQIEDLNSPQGQQASDSRNEQLHQTKQETTQIQFSQNEQDQVQGVILKHEEPSQQLIFPQSQPVAYVSQNSNDRIFENPGRNQQLLYVELLPPQGDFVQQVQFPSQTDIQNQTPLQSGLNQDEIQKDQYESAALFENSNSQFIKAEKLAAGEKYKNEEGSNSLENYDGKFGSKIKDGVDTSNKLIEHTKNLVTGQDVLNINEAITRHHNVNVESSTPQPTVGEYDGSRLVSENIITNVLINHKDISYSTSTASPITETSLNEQPIVVADLEENTPQTTDKSIELVNTSEENYESFVTSTVQTVSEGVDSSTPSTVLVTPRPISSNVLAPITAGVQLQDIEIQTEDKTVTDKQAYKVEVQQSLPYYLGKFEYPTSVYNEQHIVFNSTTNETDTAELRAAENIELGKTLLFFPGQGLPQTEIHQSPQLLYRQPIVEVNNDINVQQLPATDIKENFIEQDQQQAQGFQHHVAIQHTGIGSVYGTQPPTEITKIIHKPYPVKVPYEVPYPVVKQIQVPVTVQRIVEKPIHVTRYVEKPVPIPQPYPVEKVVEKPIHVPVQVTKYIDRPYPVEVRVPYPQPYPVEKVVQKIVKQPYPVEVRVPVPVEKIVEKKVPVPHYIEKPVEKIIEKPVPQYIDRPYPVEVKVPVPQPYLVRVEVPKPYPVQVNKLIQKPIGVTQLSQASNANVYTIPQTLQFGIPLHIYSQTGYSNKHSEQQSQHSQQQPTYFYANPYAYAPQINQYLPPKQEITVSNGYLPAAPSGNAFYLKKGCDQQNLDSNIHNFYHKIKPDDSIGLLPPKLSGSELKFVKKFRTARSNFDEKTVRMEYGFMPPLIPSLEIDEQGNPIDRTEK